MAAAAETKVLGGLEASLAIARVTLTRTLRGRALWVVLVLSGLPTLFAAILKAWSHMELGYVVGMWSLLFAILPPVLLASAIGEEVEERTMTYLWSRPIPRWSVVIGKMVALVPLLWVAFGAAILVPFYLFVPDATAATATAVRLIAVTVLATAGVSAVTAGLTALAPRHGTIFSIAYLVFIDQGLAVIDTSVSRLSVVYNATQLAGIEHPATDAGGSIAWLAALIALWVGLAVWKIRRLE